MTNRKCCGSCRFFDSGTVQGHGWCRNPDYEDRDETVLLRAEELACRTRWNNSFWHAAADPTNAELIAAAPPPVGQEATLPIGQGIAALAQAEAVAAPRPGVATARPAASAPNRRRTGQPGAIPTIVQPRAQEAAPLAAALQGHPELGANGEMLRKPNRSVVADAHRRAMERRESERDQALIRRQQQHDAALATMYASGKSASTSEGTPRAAEPIPTPGPTFPTSPAGPLGVAAAPPMVAERPAAAPLPEADDRAIAPDRPAAVIPATNVPPRAEETVGIPSSRSLGIDLPGAPALTPRRLPELVAAAPVALAAATAGPQATNPAKYWYEQGAGRFTRMRQEQPERPAQPALQSAPQQAATVPVSVPTVGRSRDDVPSPSETLPTGGRMIRPFTPLAATEPFDVEAIPTPTPTPARIPRPSAPVAEARPVEPKPVALPPRQIDEQLIKQLQQGWREQALARHSGQRCGTCRFFQATDGAERGSCGCPSAESYRKAQERQDLGCLNSLGIWWAADDTGWLQKTEFGPRRPTPLIDEMISELGIPDAPTVPDERRRVAR